LESLDRTIKSGECYCIGFAFNENAILMSN
jgi:hypothetical protein